MDAIALLRTDHQRVLEIPAQLERGASSATGADEGQLAARKDLVTELVIAKSAHEAMEEQYFWPMVRNRVADGEELAKHAVGQEDAAKQVLHVLDYARPDRTDFEAMVARIITEGREHIEYEQTKVWPKLQAAVSRRELAKLGEKMARAKEKARPVHIPLRRPVQARSTA